ncbi:hypothetical protein AERO8C_70091 [Aeromonas veronii]|uniref:Uncharacterized protein n=1 Tax=Aeromonas veronii TaxID=654 RepID=A0A653LAG4_AERVE|nr:hypothetical protein AERO8C_70091 [Aeromonas veronii]
MADAAQGVGLGVGAKPGEGEQGHVGDGVLVAGGDKGQQAPPDGDEACGPFGAQRHPDGEADQPVAEDPLHKQGQRRCLGLGQRHLVGQTACVRQQAAAVGVDERHHDGANQVAGPGLRQDAQQVGHGDFARLHPEGEEHGVAGEQLGAGDDHQRQGDAEGGPHHQRSDARIHQITEGEDEDDAEAHIGPRHGGAEPEAELVAALEAVDAGRVGGALVDGFRVHLVSP